MTDRDPLDARIRTWLAAEAPDRAPDRLRDSVDSRLDATAQGPRRRWGPPRLVFTPVRSCLPWRASCCCSAPSCSPEVSAPPRHRLRRRSRQHRPRLRHLPARLPKVWCCRPEPTRASCSCRRSASSRRPDGRRRPTLRPCLSWSTRSGIDRAGKHQHTHLRQRLRLRRSRRRAFGRWHRDLNLASVGTRRH